MNKLKALVVALVTISAIGASAAREGNGGDGVLCYNDDGSFKSLELLDLYEAREEHGLDLDLDDGAATAEEAAQYQINKLADWNMHDNYQERINTFMAKVSMVDRELVDIPDSHNTLLPENCELKQIAINYLSSGIVEISEVLWNQLSVSERGALILHELFYEDYLQSGYLDSIQARRMNSFIHGNHSRVFEPNGGLKLESFNRLLKLGIPAEVLSDVMRVQEIVIASPLDSIKKELISSVEIDWRDIESDYIDYMLSLIEEKNMLFWSFPEEYFLDWSMDISRNMIGDEEVVVTDHEHNQMLELNRLSVPLLEYIEEMYIVDGESFSTIWNKFNQVSKIRFLVEDLIRYNNDEEAYQIVSRLYLLEREVVILLPVESSDDVIDEIENMKKRAGLTVYYQMLQYANLSSEYENFLEVLLNKEDPLHIDFNVVLSYLTNNNIDDGQLMDSFFNKILSYDIDAKYGVSKSHFISKFISNGWKKDEIMSVLSDALVSPVGAPLDSIEAVSVLSQSLPDMSDEDKHSLMPAILKFLDDALGGSREIELYYKSIGKILSDLFSSNELPAGLVPLIVNQNKKTGFGKYTKSILDILLQPGNITDEVRDHLAYMYRFNMRYAFERLNSLSQFTPYIDSVLRQELKRRKSDETKLIEILELIDGMPVDNKTETSLQHLASTSEFERVRLKAQSILDEI